MTNWQLLKKFADDNSQAAFAQLSQRYTNLVYRVCQRELGDTSLAEDAAEAVFLILARKASALHPNRQEATLPIWLFLTALLTAKNARRQEQRRMAKEQEAAQMQPPAASPEWTEIEPLLNDALEALPPGQRSLLIERFFYDRPLAEIGAGQGISEDAARMRANRYAKVPAALGFAEFGGLPMWGTEPNAGMPFVALGKRLEDAHSSQMSAPVYSLGQPVVLDLPGVPGPMPFDVVIAQRHWLTPVGTIVNDPEIVTYYIGQRDHLLYKLTAAYKFSPTDWDTRTELINRQRSQPEIARV